MTTEVVVVNETNTVVTENTVTNVVEVMAVGTTATVDVIAEGPAGPPGGQVTVQDEGVDVAPLEDKLNFVGSMVNVTNNPATETVTVTVTAPSPTISLTGAVTGSGTMTNLGNVSIATTATADPTLTLAGDATGSATFTNLGDATLTVTVVDDSHNHIISNVDGLQDALDSKLPSASYTAADVLTKIKTVDGSGSGLDADLLDGESGAYYIDFTNATNKPDPTITLSGDATGSVTLTDLASGTLSVTVVDDSHNHIISNVDGLQDALDAKAPLASPTFTGTVTLPSTTSVGTVSATEIGYLDGVTSGIQAQIDTKLASADYTAADVLTKIKTVDGAGSGLDADLLDGQSSAYYTAINDRLGYTAENAANKGIAGGYASLDGAGLVPSTQLPSYVDDVLEYANVAAFPATGVSGVIYVAIDTSKTYRWSGSTYVEISASPGTTDALTEGTVNLYFTTARARQSVSAGTGISYNNSTGVITNSAPDQTVALTAGTGISTSGTYPNFTITNSAPDQTVALTAGTGISTSGTYPNFTITNAAPDQTVVLTAGTGISTSGTYPNFTITNSAPDQTVALTGAGTTSISGTYPNFTISSADQYVGTVTSVALSGGTTGLTVTGSPITSSGTITLGGTLAITNGGTGATTASGARTNLGLGTAATTDASAYATAAQGAKADTAVQTISSADGSVTITGTTAIDLSVAIAGATSNVLLPIRNTTGATLTKGTAVYISGATGQLSTVSKAIATSDATSAQTLGLITADLANNSNGNVTLIGTITNINTSAYSDGQQLYLSPTTAGTLTATKPYAPDHLVYMAVVEHAHPTQGKLFVKVQNGYELDELHDVSAQSPTNGQTIIYNSTSGLWEKNTVSLTAGVNGTLPVANGGTGQTSYTDGQLLIGNSTGNTLSKATLTAGTNVSITNGSGSITINATDQYVGTVTSVAALTLGTTGTDLSSTVANGTTTPVITLNVPTASASNRGALSSTDWSTFNGKQAALVSGSNIKTVNGTSLLGSGDLGTIGIAYGGTGATSLTSGYLLKGNGTSAVSASVVYDDGTNVGIGTTSPTTLFDLFSATAANLSVRGNSATNITAHRSSTDATGPNLVLRKSRGTSASQTAVATGDNMGTLVFSAFGGTNNRNIASIASNVEYYVSDSLLSSNLIFSTTSVSTTPTEVMRIDSSGNVGIATASPGAKLDVVAQNAIRATGSQPFLTLRDSGDSNKGSRIQTASGATLFSNDSTGGGTYTERMRIDASGNVGIGTTSPAAKLDIVDQNNAGFRFVQYSNADGAILRVSSALGTIASPVALATDSVIYGLRGFGYSSAGAFGASVVQINGRAAENFTATGQGTYIQFATTTIGATTSAERMRITDAGNVGIGTTSPQARLHTDNASSFTQLAVGGSASVAGINFRNSVYTNGYIYYDNGASMNFQTNGSEKMRIDSIGNVGIGTTGPSSILHAVASGAELRAQNTNTGQFFSGRVRLKGPAGTYRSTALVHGNNNAGGTNTYFAIEGSNSSDNYLQTLALYDYASQFWGFSTNSAERMRIANDGSVTLNVGGVSNTHQFLYNESGGEIQLIDSTGAGPILIDNVSGLARFYKVGSGAISMGTTGANYFQFITNGSERARITSSGDFLVGTSSGGRTAVFYGSDMWIRNVNANRSWLTGLSTGFDYLIYDETAGLERFRITTAGNVGIGTSSPSQKLTLQGAQLIIPSAGWSSGQVAYMYLGDTNNGVSATNGSYQTYFSFNGHNWLVNGTEAMRIDGARSVGIGTTTPQCIFNVKTGTAWVQNYSGSAASPSETVDWPVPAITATSYGNYTLQTMMAFALPNDGNYFTGNSVWTIRLNQTASSTTSAGVNGLEFIGPGYLALGAGQNERMRITSSGDVVIGATTASGKLHVETTSTGDVIYVAANTGGTAGQSVYVIPVRTAGTLRGGIQWNGSNLLYNNSSDARLKDNVADADDTASLIDAIQVRKFDWKESGTHQRYGFIAQELIEVAPEAVHQPEDEEEMMGVDYSKLVPMLIKEVQSLRARVAQLEGK